LLFPGQLDFRRNKYAGKARRRYRVGVPLPWTAEEDNQLCCAWLPGIHFVRPATEDVRPFELPEMRYLERWKWVRRGIFLGSRPVGCGFVQEALCIQLKNTEDGVFGVVLLFRTQQTISLKSVKCQVERIPEQVDAGMNWHIP
jgi:hypothetical protein